MSEETKSALTEEPQTKSAGEKDNDWRRAHGLEPLRIEPHPINWLRFRGRQYQARASLERERRVRGGQTRSGRSSETARRASTQTRIK